MTVGSRSIMTALGTCLPDPVSEKKVEKESSPPPRDCNHPLIRGLSITLVSSLSPCPRGTYYSLISSCTYLIRGHLSIWLDSVLQTVQLPASIADLHASLADVDGDDLTLEERESKRVGERGERSLSITRSLV